MAVYVYSYSCVIRKYQLETPYRSIHWQYFGNCLAPRIIGSPSICRSSVKAKVVGRKLLTDTLIVPSTREMPVAHVPRIAINGTTKNRSRSGRSSESDTWMKFKMCFNFFNFTEFILSRYNTA